MYAIRSYYEAGAGEAQARGARPLVGCLPSGIASRVRQCDHLSQGQGWHQMTQPLKITALCVAIRHLAGDKEDKESIQASVGQEQGEEKAAACRSPVIAADQPEYDRHKPRNNFV